MWEYDKDVILKWPQLSLNVLDVFFENDLANHQSVKPMIEKYIHFAALPVDDSVIVERGEQSLSDLLKSLQEMNASDRQDIFGEKNLSSLTIFIEILIKSGIQNTVDLQAFWGNEQKISIIEKSLQKKGYINIFIINVLDSIFGRRDMKKRDKSKDGQAVGAKSLIKSVVPQEFITSVRKVQIFPAVSGGGIWGIQLVIAFISSLILAIVGSGFLGIYDVSIQAQCDLTIKQYGAAQAAAVCSANPNYQVIGYVLVALAVAFAIWAIFAGVKLAMIVLHNSFALSHNTFEMVHHEFMKNVKPSSKTSTHNI
ncbi:MAG: hypothetical protein LBM13_06335 [Candidatus Ancillula sp.]|jgi:hypothetical protein|nr:hypothetical protein [Candidatus Ancillula sp.]